MISDGLLKSTASLMPSPIIITGPFFRSERTTSVFWPGLRLVLRSGGSGMENAGISTDRCNCLMRPRSQGAPRPCSPQLRCADCGRVGTKILSLKPGEPPLELAAIASSICANSSPRPGAGSTTSGSVASPLSPRLSGVTDRAKGRRLLAPLAFVSLRIIAAIVDGSVPADLTVTGLAKALPCSWAEQEQGIGLPNTLPSTT
jgi:hypothetical protein